MEVLEPALGHFAPSRSRRTGHHHVQALHRARSRLIDNRTAVINQLRGFLFEHGIPVRQGLRFLRQQLPQILATRTIVLSPRMVRIIWELMADWEYR